MSVLDIKEDVYQQMVGGESDKPVLMVFCAPWCSYCRRLAPALERFARQHADDLVVGQINIDSEPELTQREQIEVVPTLLLYRRGQLLGSMVAPESRAQLEAFLAEHTAAC